MDETRKILGLLLCDDDDLAAQFAFAQRAGQVHDVKNEQLVIVDELGKIVA